MMKRNNLWAPWRIAYIESFEKEQKIDSECIFCNKKEADEKKYYILAKGKYSFSLLNLYPYNNGHLMVAPYRHIGDLSSLEDDEILEMFNFVKIFKEKIKEKMKCDGFNIGINLGRTAGAGVEDHIHIHLVPRWNGDTNFMPIIGDAKVIPQSLEKTWELLRLL